ncbi:MAG: class I SAM-dependent methyltransferase [Pseudomonadota bacterium]
MLNEIKKAVKRAAPNAFLAPQGPEGIAKSGHRKYVGGLWEEMGQHQLDFLISRGMEPQHRLLDVACGSLRLGVVAIPYLNAGHYLGIEKEEMLIEAGLKEELPKGLADEKSPKFVISSEFEFSKFGVQADYGIAQSLFSHLTPEVIDLCFERLLPAMAPGGKFYGTYFRSDGTFKNPRVSHDHGIFKYTEDEMIGFGTRAGFETTYIGDWGHPRNQVVTEYRRPLA